MCHPTPLITFRPAMFFAVILFSIAGISFTNALNRRGHHIPLISCPSCEHHVCDLSNTMQCEVCQIIIPHQHQPPQDVKCVHDGHCHEDNHNYCCDTQACVDSIFGHFNRATTTTNQHFMQTTDHFAHCPRCHGGHCDFVNRDRCYMCKFDLHQNQLPHVHCLKQTEHCDPNHSLCCKEETCIARAFGGFYPPLTQPSITTVAHNAVHVTTQPAGSTHHHRFVFCPICNDHSCSTTSSHYHCVGCIYHYDHRTTHCVKQGHEHECRNSPHHICCTRKECITSLIAHTHSSTTVHQPAVHTDHFAHCPHCHGGYCDFVNRDQCYMCKFDLHDHQLPHVHCLKHEDCKASDKTLCCKEETCIAQAFGGFYPISSHTPIHTTVRTTTGANNQGTSQPVQTFSTTHPNSTTILTTQPMAVSNTTVPSTTPLRSSPPTIHSSGLGSNLNHSSTASVGTAATAYSKQNTTVPGTLKTTIPSSSVVAQTTHALGSNHTTARTAATSSSGTTTNESPSTLTTLPNNCTDNISNCINMKMVGVCHALPVQKVSYDIAFLNCRATCNLCTETYQPLTTTTTAKPPISCEVCGDFDQNIPCDTRSVYTGHAIQCPGGNNYCMTDIVHDHNNVKIYKRCVNETVCRTQWLSQTSDQDHCTNYGNVAISRDFSCHFCCTSDNCNQGLLPNASTFYVKP